VRKRTNSDGDAKPCTVSDATRSASISARVASAVRRADSTLAVRRRRSIVVLARFHIAEATGRCRRLPELARSCYA
jgi:hypothetical protein